MAVDNKKLLGSYNALSSGDDKKSARQKIENLAETNEDYKDLFDAIKSQETTDMQGNKYGAGASPIGSDMSINRNQGRSPETQLGMTRELGLPEADSIGQQKSPANQNNITRGLLPELTASQVSSNDTASSGQSSGSNVGTENEIIPMKPTPLRPDLSDRLGLPELSDSVDIARMEITNRLRGNQGYPSELTDEGLDQAYKSASGVPSGEPSKASTPSSKAIDDVIRKDSSGVADWFKDVGKGILSGVGAVPYAIGQGVQDIANLPQQDLAPLLRGMQRALKPTPPRFGIPYSAGETFGTAASESLGGYLDERQKQQELALATQKQANLLEEQKARIGHYGAQSVKELAEAGLYGAGGLGFKPTGNIALYSALAEEQLKSEGIANPTRQQKLERANKLLMETEGTKSKERSEHKVTPTNEMDLKGRVIYNKGGKKFVNDPALGEIEHTGQSKPITVPKTTASLAIQRGTVDGVTDIETVAKDIATLTPATGTIRDIMADNPGMSRAEALDIKNKREEKLLGLRMENSMKIFNAKQVMGGNTFGEMLANNEIAPSQIPVQQRVGAIAEAKRLNPNLSPALAEEGYKKISSPVFQKQYDGMMNLLAGEGILNKIVEAQKKVAGKIVKSDIKIINGIKNKFENGISDLNSAEMTALHKMFGEEGANFLAGGRGGIEVTKFAQGLLDTELSAEAFAVNANAIKSQVANWIQQRVKGTSLYNLTRETLSNEGYDVSKWDVPKRFSASSTGGLPEKKTPSAPPTQQGKKPTGKYNPNTGKVEAIK